MAKRRALGKWERVQGQSKTALWVVQRTPGFSLGKTGGTWKGFSRDVTGRTLTFIYQACPGCHVPPPFQGNVAGGFLSHWATSEPSTYHGRALVSANTGEVRSGSNFPSNSQDAKAKETDGHNHLLCQERKSCLPYTCPSRFGQRL